MGSVATTSPYQSTTSPNWRASATVLFAALAGAQVASTTDEYIRGATMRLLRGHTVSGEISTYQTAFVGQSLTDATTHVREPDAWQELENLEDDWDANGANKISLEAIAHARTFLSSLPDLGRDFTPFPDPDGRVGLQARSSDKAAYLLISPENRFTYVIKVRGKTHRGTQTEPEEMKDLLALLY